MRSVFRHLSELRQRISKGLSTPFTGETLYDTDASDTGYSSDAYFEDRHSGPESPLRAKLFSIEQMELHAQRLAASHILSADRSTDLLLARLADNEAVLVEVCQQLAEHTNRQLIPAAEWLLDNFYLIEEQIRTARRHFPKGYSRTLPRLANGPSAGLPRVYDIALEVISHGDGRVDLEVLSRFVTSFQTVSALGLGELWAIPIMLRLALIENLRRVAARITASRTHRQIAGKWADQMLEVAEKDPKSLILVISDMARSRPPMVSAFVAELARRLQGHIPASALPLSWIEQLLSESNVTIEQLVRLEAQQQAADQVSIGNSIGSLRFLGATDWREFVENTSAVEKMLADDPAGTYKNMNFATRDDYRHAVEKISRRSATSEPEVARQAIALAQAAAQRGDERAAHVGYYLIDKGLPLLESAVSVRPSHVVALKRFLRRHALVFFLGSIGAGTALITALLLVEIDREGWSGWQLVPIAVLMALCANRLAVALVNWLATVLTQSKALPRMDFSAGIPAAVRTLVVVPTLLSRAEVIDELCETLEVRFLANRDDHVHFALLTDFLDAPTETCANDAELLQLASARVAALNAKYDRDNLFFLLHRRREWNPQERTWMGYERKRGKLIDLNAFLHGGARERFVQVVGDTAILSSVKYVITLDTDTQLPRDSARELVAAMAHPLNRAQFANDYTATPLRARERIVAGYAILQPLVAMSVAGANASRYAHLFGAEAGIDPYTRVVADVYQNVFREGSFIGKGIYDVEAFERALLGRIPENRILSHDLLEGCIARSGLLSDSQLYEEYPAQYGADVRRRQRWIRGDWQLLGWLFARVPCTPGVAAAEPNAGRSVLRATACKLQRNPLSALSRWKILDNLLRSLASSALTLLLLFGWLLSAAPLFWTAAALGVLLIPALCVALLHLFRKPADMLLTQHLAVATRTGGNHLGQATLTLACLPYDAYFSLDAIARTLARMLTQRHLLEWCPSSEAEHNRRHDFFSVLRSMWIAPAGAALTIGYIALQIPGVLPIAAPIALLWFFSPLIISWINAPLVAAPPQLTREELFFLRKTARRTWAFFEKFVSAEDNWLPPDNYQEYRGAVIAHRTSPTNMGMALLANLTAYDFGYIPTGLLLERTANTLRSMSALERHQDHFYNWYDTLTLQPLHPIYISTVDSGNLSGHLLVLRQGLLALPDHAVFAPNWIAGLRDAAAIVKELAGDSSTALVQLLKTLKASEEQLPATLEAALRCLDDLSVCVAALIDTSTLAADSDAHWWIQTLVAQMRTLRDELHLLAPWRALPAPTECEELLQRIDNAFAASIPTLRELARVEKIVLPLLEQQRAATPAPLAQEWLHEVRALIIETGRAARERMAVIEDLAAQAEYLAQMQYEFLFDKTRRLLAIGYNVSERRRDASFYDLLASEARMANFLAIAQRHLPQESWFALGRLLVSTGGAPILLSWSGSMFEYLMPLLVMPTYANTLLSQTNASAVARQIEYGKLRGVPWGVSESGYNTVDVQLNYQYHAFGVPGLGLKRGLADDLVIAPYATALALMVAPEAACANLQRLAAIGMQGKYGFYEAIDYTPSRQRRGEASTIVRSFMAHHQGMSLLALAFLLLDRPMQRRFEADLVLQSTLMLLQERIPKPTADRARASELADLPMLPSTAEIPVRTFDTPHTPSPEVQLLSNGRYHVMITNAGGGYSRWNDLAVTRWQEDATQDNWGTFCYIRDLASGEFWSTAQQPTLQKADSYQVIFSEGRAEFRRSDRDFDTHTEIVISPEDDIELRRIHITNTARIRRSIEVTTYAEVVIASPASDALHPAFSNLFVQTEILRERHAILCTRRPRSQHETPPWMLHLMAVHGAEVEAVSYETDRSQFIGRGNTLINPAAMNTTQLTNSSGSVLDPIVAIRYRLSLEPDQCATIDIVSGIGENRDSAVGLVEKYQDRHLADRVFDLAWTHSQVLLRQLNASESDAQLYGRLASSIIYANVALRAEASVLIKNRLGQSRLWAYAISGDLPIVLLQIQDSSNIELVRLLVQAHAYWRLKGLAVDLVILNEDSAGYRQPLQDLIIGLIGAGPEAHVIDRPAGIFVRSSEQMAHEDKLLLQAVARVVLSDARGTLAEHLNRRIPSDVRIPRLAPVRATRRDAIPELPAPPPVLLDNGLGGFSADGSEYVITLAPGRVTPVPWANVLANPHFGTVISESGRAYTWSENAHEFRLTPWYNDVVSDSSGEAFYLRDDDSGEVWSATPLPCPGSGTYVCRHGFGYSVFEHSENGIYTELTIFVARDAAIKFSLLKVRNDTDRARSLSATGFVEWTLGDLRPKTAQHIVTEIDPNSGALCARNPYSAEFPNSIAFFDVDDTPHSFTGDRREFIGRNSSQRNPSALARLRLSGKVGAALDPCAAIQIPFELAAGQEREIVFRLGLGADASAVTRLIQSFRGATTAHAELIAVRAHWRHTLSAVKIETPDTALNMLTNGWLVYQVIACRLWARSGYYQSGGAFGFRDQLQDTMALVHTAPQHLREQILLCASRQFIEGDVQHWWHPPSGRGVRTHCSDDFLWLPLATSRYVLSSGDTGVLNENVAFLEGRAVNAGDESYYDLPARSGDVASLYQHCVRAIRHGLRFGTHGLPLIGSGDWNDGMNLVGIDGRGESIWLGFFLCEILTQFARVAELHGDTGFAVFCIEQHTLLRTNLETHGWDGEWYRRAYFDDGTALGSARNEECQIDSISQSWSVFSTLSAAKLAGNDAALERSRTAMDAVYRRLVRHEHALIQLLDPPFDQSAMNPGYIKGYVPGVRENGGQYTHGAIWAAMAFAGLGDGERAWELLRMINPAMHGLSADAVATYKAEPYVVAADVYAVEPHTGRGGWSWYTGSAGWMYRLIIESLLGLRLDIDRLHFAPCLPADWQGCTIHYRFRETPYRIDVTQRVDPQAKDTHAKDTQTEITVLLDGNACDGPTIALVNDRHPHVVTLNILPAPESAAKSHTELALCAVSHRHLSPPDSP